MTHLLEAHTQSQGLSLCTNLAHSRSNKGEDFTKAENDADSTDQKHTLLAAEGTWRRLCLRVGLPKVQEDSNWLQKSKFDTRPTTHRSEWYSALMEKQHTSYLCNTGLVPKSRLEKPYQTVLQKREVIWKKLNNTGLSEVQKQIRSLQDVNQHHTAGFRLFRSFFHQLRTCAFSGWMKHKGKSDKARRAGIPGANGNSVSASNKSFRTVLESVLGWSWVC